MHKYNDPRDCKHVLAYNATDATVYCDLCGWWWDAEFETPPARGVHGTDTARPQAERECFTSQPNLNSDNDPTSEHNTWKDNT